MKNKKFVWLMGMVLALGTVSGCGSDKAADTETVSEADETTTEESAEDTEEAAEDTTEENTADVSDGEETATEDTTEETSEKEAEGTSSSTFDSETASVAGWDLTVEDVEVNDSLENVSVSLGYTGVETSDYQKNADEDKTFCLIKMNIEKDGSKESIDWANMKVTDSEGNEYERMSDEFLTDLGMKRMPGNALNFGSNEGWIAFEVNDDAEGLELSYSFEAEEYHCAL